MESALEEFPHCTGGDVVYLDAAGKSVLPKSVEEVGVEALRSKSQPWLGMPGEPQDMEHLRELFAEFINAESANNISWCPSTAFAMSLAAKNVVRTQGLRAGQSVLVLEVEFASAVYPWQAACKEVGAHIKVVPSPDWTDPAASWTANILEALDSSVAVVALPQVHWCDGTLIDLEAVAQRLIELPGRPMLIVDATQSLGAIPLDVQRLPSLAFLACSIHKWLLGPYGMSMTFVASALADIWLPLDHHERAREGSHQAQWDEINPFHLPCQGYPEPFMSGARRLDAGGRPHFVLVPMLTRALQLLRTWGVPRVHTYLRGLLDPFAERLTRRLGDYITIAAPSQRGGHFLGIRLRPGVPIDLSALAREMKSQHRVHFSVRGGCLRLAPYVFCTPRDLFVFEAVFSQMLLRHVAGPRRRVLVLGGSAWLGQFAAAELLGDATLDVHFTFARGPPLQWVVAERQHRADLLGDGEAHWAALLEVAQPDVVLHLAAWSSPVQCEKSPEEAYRVNAPAHFLAQLLRLRPTCRYVFTSTDMVHDGEHAPYAPLPPSELAHAPVNVYGASKKCFEEMLLQAHRAAGLDAVVLRLSNMVGAPFLYRPAGEKFLEFLYRALRDALIDAESRVVGLKDFELRSFVAVTDVARVLASLARGPVGVHEESRVINVGGPVGLSRLDLAAKLAGAVNVPLVVGDGDRAAERKTAAWRVTAMADSGVPGPVRSPRDISMLVDPSCGGLGELRHIEALLGEQARLCAALLHPHQPLW